MRALGQALLLLLLAGAAAAQDADTDYEFDPSQHQNCLPLGSRTVESKCTRKGGVALCRSKKETLTQRLSLLLGLRAAGGDTASGPSYCVSLLAIERGNSSVCYERLIFRNFTVGWADDDDYTSEDGSPMVEVNLWTGIGLMKQLVSNSSTTAFWDFTNSEFSAESGFLTAVTFNQDVVTPGPCHISLANIYNLGGTSIEKLSLYRNEFNDTDLRFGPTPNLKELRLVHCYIQNFPDDAHIQMPALETLDLAENLLSSVPATIAGMKNLKVLNLSGTDMQRLAGQLPPLPQLTELSLRNTLLCCLHQDQDAFRGVPNLQLLDISYNQLTSLGAVLRGLHRLSRLDASNNQLTEYPELQLQSEASLNFAHNRLDSVPQCAQFGSNGSHLTLELQNNQISYWDGGPNTLRCVDSLNLGNNALVNIDANMLASLNAVKTVGLSGNPLHCYGPEFEEFRKWLHTTQVEVWADSGSTGALTGLRCATPSAVQGMSVGAVPVLGATDIANGSSQGDPLVVGLSLGAAFLALCVVAAVACYRYRFELAYSAHLLRLRARARSSRRKGGTDDDVFLFDAFILYSGSDQAWVGGRLVPRLEDEPSYRVCLHERGLDSGAAKYSFSHLLDCSRHVIIVLSKRFLSSRWCLWEMALANHRTLDPSQRDYVILLELEPLERPLLPRQLRFLMETRTYLEWHRTGDAQYEEQAFRRLQQALGPRLSHTH